VVAVIVLDENSSGQDSITSTSTIEEGSGKRVSAKTDRMPTFFQPRIIEKYFGGRLD
jgi:hypothetical protein